MRMGLPNTRYVRIYILNFFQSAILHLNELQSNAMVIQKLREKREFQQERNIQETTEYLEHSGMKVSPRICLF